MTAARMRPSLLGRAHHEDGALAEVKQARRCGTDESTLQRTLPVGADDDHLRVERVRCADEALCWIGLEELSRDVGAGRTRLLLAVLENDRTPFGDRFIEIT